MGSCNRLRFSVHNPRVLLGCCRFSLRKGGGRAQGHVPPGLADRTISHSCILSNGSGTSCTLRNEPNGEFPFLVEAIHIGRRVHNRLFCYRCTASGEASDACPLCRTV